MDAGIDGVLWMCWMSRVGLVVLKRMLEVGEVWQGPIFEDVLLEE